MFQFFLLAAFLAVALSSDIVEHRLDCLLNEDIGMLEPLCRKRECLWTPSEEPNKGAIPFCYLNTKKVGYHLKGAVSKRANGLDATLQVNSEAHKSLPFAPIATLKVDVTYLTEHILRVRLTDPAHQRYEVPIQQELNIPSTHPSSTKYDVTLGHNFDLKIQRKETNATIIDTSIGGLIYSDNFLQFVTHVSSENLYGIGENAKNDFKHDFHYKTYPLFARDRQVGALERDSYGVHPVYTVLESDGKANGLFLLNSNAMAFTTLPAPAISIKAVGGILDLFIFVGNDAEHVTQLYTSIIGRPVMPPFWSLGFQLARYGYKNTEQIRKVVKRNLDNNVPIDVKYVDIDYMDEYRDFTLDPVHFKDLPEYMKETKEKNNIYWTLITDPAIQGDKPGYRTFDEGYKRDIFIRWPASIPVAERTKPGNAPTDKGVMYGHVWPKGPAAFPDFFRNATTKWWIEMHKKFHQKAPFDAIWIDMNEPSNSGSKFLKCPKTNLSHALPGQNFKESLNAHTLCMDAVQGDKGEYRHYDVHSLYGWSETKPTYLAVQESTGKRGFVVSRSTYASSGKYTAHWLGDNHSSWGQMRQSIVGMLDFSLFGLSFTGADICGHAGNTSPELCRRWLQLGAYYPYSRSHNSHTSTDQDPGYFTEIGYPEVTKAAVDALKVRYQLLHYLYTRFYRSHVHGETLVRPLHHVYPKNEEARTIDTQFFLGPSIMVSPFLYEDQTNVNAYAPTGAWYKMAGNFAQLTFANGNRVSFNDSESHRPVLIRSGAVLPIVSQSNLPKPLNTFNLRKAPIDLWVLPHHGVAQGDLFYDDGESIDTIEHGNYNYYQFSLKNCTLTISPVHTGFKAPTGTNATLKVGSIDFHPGYLTPTDLKAITVTIDGKAVKWTSINFESFKVEANIDLLTLTKPVNVLIYNNNPAHSCIIMH